MKCSSSITLLAVACLVMCLCDVGAVLVAKENSVPSSNSNGPKPIAPQQRQQQQQQQERPTRRSQPEDERLRQVDDDQSSDDTQWVEPIALAAAARRQQLDDAATQPDYWRDNEVITAPAGGVVQQQQQQQVGGEDMVEQQQEQQEQEQQLNWHEAQLARLHGLGPAEIAALSTWQHKLRLHPLPNRLATATWHHQSPSSFSSERRPLSAAHGPSVVGKSTASRNSNSSSQQVLTPFDNVDNRPTGPTYKLERAAINNNQTTRPEDSDNLLLLPLWPKRSALGDANKKSDRENNNQRNRNNAANRKEKTESPTKGGGKGSKGSRKQQQQQQQEQQQHGRGSSATPDGVVQLHEHNGLRPGGSSPTSDVNRMNRNLATQFLLRSPRENRQYDVPIIGKSKTLCRSFIPYFTCYIQSC